MFRNQRNGNRRTSGIQPAALFERLGSRLRVVEIKDERVEPLLMKTVKGRGDVTESLHGNPRGGQNPAQDLGSGIVTGNQQCEKGHN
jgi:hypothetical protein